MVNKEYKFVICVDLYVDIGHVRSDGFEGDQTDYLLRVHAHPAWLAGPELSVLVEYNQ